MEERSRRELGSQVTYAHINTNTIATDEERVIGCMSAWLRGCVRTYVCVRVCGLVRAHMVFLCATVDQKR